MSAQKPSQVQAEEAEKLRQELRNLPRAKAPWYFESQLQQRLQQGPSPRGFTARPLLATAVTVLVVAVVGSVGYYAYFGPLTPQPETAPPTVTPFPESPAPADQSSRASGPERQPVLVPAENGSMNSGPSDLVNGVARGNHAVSAQPERSTQELPAALPRADTEAEQNIAPRLEAPPVRQLSAPATAETLRVITDTASKRRDSLRTSAPDTLRRIR